MKHDDDDYYPILVNHKLKSNFLSIKLNDSLLVWLIKVDTYDSSMKVHSNEIMMSHLRLDFFFLASNKI